jgi:hypothetical protein
MLTTVNTKTINKNKPYFLEEDIFLDSIRKDKHVNFPPSNDSPMGDGC